MKMNRIMSLILAVIIIFTLSIPVFAAENEAVSRTIVVKSVDGNNAVYVKGAGAKREFNLAAGKRLASGYVLTTGGGTEVSLVLDDETIVKMAANTKLDISEVKGKRLKLTVLSGSIAINAAKQENSSIDVSVGNVTAGIRGTIITVSYPKSANPIITVLEGLLQAYNSELSQEMLIGAGEVVDVLDSEKPESSTEMVKRSLDLENIDSLTLETIIEYFDKLKEEEDLEIGGLDELKELLEEVRGKDKEKNDGVIDDYVQEYVEETAGGGGNQPANPQRSFFVEFKTSPNNIDYYVQNWPAYSVYEGEFITSYPTAAKLGSSFMGWYTQPAGGVKWNSTLPVTADLELYAQFTPIPGQDGTSASTAFVLDSTNIVHFPYLANTASGSSLFYKLGGNINMSAVPWRSVGSSTLPFDGDFDGGGYTLSNVVMQHSMFEVLGSSASVHDLTVESITANGLIVSVFSLPSIISGGGLFSAKLLAAPDLAPVGGIVGRNMGIVDNIKIKGAIKLAGCEYLGGIAGYNEGTISNCTIGADVPGNFQLSKTSGSVIDEFYAGGVAGYNAAAGVIENCDVSVNIVLDGSAIGAARYALGGIAGYNEKIIADNIVSAYIQTTGTGSSPVAVGGVSGIVGASGTVSGTAASSTVSTSGGAGADIKAGGIAGALEGSAQITDCYTTGSITAPTAGGIAGDLSGTAAVQSCFSTAAVAGTASAGGIAGELNGSAAVTGVIAINSAISAPAANSGRVVGIAEATAAISSARAYIDMNVNGSKVSSTDTNATDAKKNGASANTDYLRTQTNWPNFDFTASGSWNWIIEDDIIYLPKLKAFPGSASLSIPVNDLVTRTVKLEVSVNQADYLIKKTADGSLVSPTEAVLATLSIADGADISGLASSLGAYTFVKIGYTYTGKWTADGTTPYEGAVTSNLTLNPLFAENTGETGESDTAPYLLNTANIEHFQYFANSDDGIGAHYKLAEIIDLGAGAGNADIADWKPIGTAAKPFTGVLHGNDFTINNYKSNKNGMFAYIGGGATIRNLKIANISITNGETDPVNIGGIVGHSSGATIQFCSAIGSITNSGSVDSATGGLIGNAVGESLRVLDSYADVDISASGMAGGIIGYAALTVNNPANLVGTSYSLGDITSANESAGGLVGSMNNFSIKDCYVNGEIKGASAGGLVGVLSGNTSIASSFAVGTVESHAVSSIYGGAGGIAGTAFASGNTLSNVYAVNTTINSGTAGYAKRILGDEKDEASISNAYAHASTKIDGGLVVSANAASVNGASRTSAQLANKDLWMGFDFSSTWQWNDSNTCMPMLRAHTGSALITIPADGGDIAKLNLTLNFADDLGEYIVKDIEKVIINEDENPVIPVDPNTDIDDVDELDEYKFIKIGQTFAGWGTKTGGALQAFDGLITDNMTLYPMFTVNTDVGSKTAPYLLNADNFEHFQYFGNTAHGSQAHYLLSDDYENVVDDAYVIKDWTPIGTMDQPFAGSFDGNDYTISGHFSKQGGLFGYTEKALIENVVMPNVNIVIEDDDISYVGIIAGHAVDTQFNNCVVNGGINAKESIIGGIVGLLADGENGDIAIDKCGAYVGLDGSLAGGIVGRVEATAVHEDGVVTECYSQGNVKASGNASGIAANTEGAGIKDCYSTCDVTGENAGGIAGEMKNNGASIMNCYATGKILAENYCGGIVGLIDDTLPEEAVTNVVAANTEIEATSYNINRISLRDRNDSEEPLISNAYAFWDMLVNKKFGSLGDNGDSGSASGRGWKTEDFAVEENWPAVFFAGDGAWQWNDTDADGETGSAIYMPKLKAHPTADDVLIPIDVNQTYKVILLPGGYGHEEGSTEQIGYSVFSGDGLPVNIDEGLTFVVPRGTYIQDINNDEVYTFEPTSYTSLKFCGWGSVDYDDDNSLFVVEPHLANWYIEEDQYVIPLFRTAVADASLD